MVLVSSPEETALPKREGSSIREVNNKTKHKLFINFHSFIALFYYCHSCFLYYSFQIKYTSTYVV